VEVGTTVFIGAEPAVLVVREVGVLSDENVRRVQFRHKVSVSAQRWPVRAPEQETKSRVTLDWGSTSSIRCAVWYCDEARLRSHWGKTQGGLPSPEPLESPRATISESRTTTRLFSATVPVGAPSSNWVAVTL
jgi:hypothetical protein